jgi:hypothetical protein
VGVVRDSWVDIDEDDFWLQAWKGGEIEVEELVKKGREEELVKKRREKELVKKRREEELVKKRREEELVKEREP